LFLPPLFLRATCAALRLPARFLDERDYYVSDKGFKGPFLRPEDIRAGTAPIQGMNLFCVRRPLLDAVAGGAPMAAAAPAAAPPVAAAGRRRRALRLAAAAAAGGGGRASAAVRLPAWEAWLEAAAAAGVHRR
jgi:hypothetical protein